VPEQVKQILGVPEVDAAVDCVGFEARGHRDGTEQNAAVLNQAMEVTRAAGEAGCRRRGHGLEIHRSGRRPQ
jgi:glutathione-independent formaldehyde dehydrogenase